MQYAFNLSGRSLCGPLLWVPLKCNRDTNLKLLLSVLSLLSFLYIIVIKFFFSFGIQISSILYITNIV